MGEHLIDGEFQSDKYPATPRGKVPLSTKDPAAQDLLWIYAQRRRAGSHGSKETDAVFASDVEEALRLKGFEGASSAYESLVKGAADMLAAAKKAIDDIVGWSGGSGNWPALEAAKRVDAAISALNADGDERSAHKFDNDVVCPAVYKWVKGDGPEPYSVAVASLTCLVLDLLKEDRQRRSAAAPPDDAPAPSRGRSGLWGVWSEQLRTWAKVDDGSRRVECTTQVAAALIAKDHTDREPARRHGIKWEARLLP